MSNNISIKKRSRARRFAMQALYSWRISNNSLYDIEKHCLADRNEKKFDVEYFKLLLHSVPKNKEQLNTAIAKCSTHAIDQIDPISCSILHIACYELIFCKELPHKVVISEALNLASMFGTENSYKFINSVLDTLVRQEKIINN